MPDIYEMFLDRYKSYTEIQKVAIPIVSQKSNCLIVAPTGSGKTEAAVLSLLDAMAQNPGKDGIQVLYITPLRALNRDMLSRLESLCAAMRVSVAVRHGDTAQSERARQARKAPMLLITTPETLQSILPTKSMNGALHNIKAVVVDEMHELMYSKRGAQLSLALERLEEIAKGYQRIGISATIGDTDICDAVPVRRARVQASRCRCTKGHRSQGRDAAERAAGNSRTSLRDSGLTGQRSQGLRR